MGTASVYLLRFLALVFMQLWSDRWYCQGRFLQLESSTSYNHQVVPHIDLGYSTSITFSLRSCKDSFISLQPSATNVYGFAYEIQLQGKEFPRSVIRDGSEGYYRTELAVYNVPVISCDETKDFWLSWANGISVGKGTVINQDTIMKTSQHIPYAVSALSVTTNNGARGIWSFKYGSGDFVTLSTNNEVFYHPVLNYDLTRKTSFKFSLMACNDANIRLEPVKGVSVSTTYDFTIGGWGTYEFMIGSHNNVKSVLRKGGIDHVAVAGSPLDCRIQRDFWISWSSATLRLGVGTDINGPFIFTYSDAIFPVGGISVLTAYGATGFWLFKE